MTERITQVIIETLEEPEQSLRVTQAMIEALEDPEQSLRVTQVFVEVLTQETGHKYKAYIL